MSTTRRAFLRTTAGATFAAAAASGALAVEAASAEPSDALAVRLDALLAGHITQVRECRRLDGVYGAAMERVPAWARPGPEYLFHDGTKGGGNVGWPEVATLPKPSEHEGGMRVIRPSLHKVWKDA